MTAKRTTRKMIVQSFFLSFIARPNSLGISDTIVNVIVTRKARGKAGEHVDRHYTIRSQGASITRIQNLFSDNKLKFSYMHMPVYPTVNFVRNDKELR